MHTENHPLFPLRTRCKLPLFALRLTRLITGTPAVLYLYLVLFLSPVHAGTLPDDHNDSGDALEFNQVWIAEAPPVSRVLAAYMSIQNHSDKDISILSAESKHFSSTAFHRTIYKNGVASMQHQSTLTIPAHQTLQLEPGGFHMMLFNPVNPLQAGDSVEFSFTLDNQTIKKVTAIVKKTE